MELLRELGSPGAIERQSYGLSLVWYSYVKLSELTRGANHDHMNLGQFYYGFFPRVDHQLVARHCPIQQIVLVSREALIHLGGGMHSRQFSAFHLRFFYSPKPVLEGSLDRNAACHTAMTRSPPQAAA